MSKLVQSEFRSWELAKSVRLHDKSQCKRQKSPINTQLIQRYAGEKRQEESGSRVWSLSCCNKFPPAMSDKTESTSRGVRAKNKGKYEDEEMELVWGDIYSCYGCMSSPYRQSKGLFAKRSISSTKWIIQSLKFWLDWVNFLTHPEWIYEDEYGTRGVCCCISKSASQLIRSNRF